MKHTLPLLLVVLVTFVFAQEQNNTQNNANAVQKIMTEGKELIQRHQYDKGLTKYLEAYEIQEAADNPDLLYATSQAFHNVGNIEKSIEYINKGIKAAKKSINPSFTSDAYFLLANNYRFLGDYDKAIQQYKRSMKENEKTSKSIWNRLRSQVAITHSQIDKGINVPYSTISNYKKEQKLLTDPKQISILDKLILRASYADLSTFETKYKKIYTDLEADKNPIVKRNFLNMKKEFYINHRFFKKAVQIENDIDKINEDILQSNNDFRLQAREAQLKKEISNAESEHMEAQKDNVEKISSQKSLIYIISALGLGIIALLSVLLMRLMQRINKQKKHIAHAAEEKEGHTSVVHGCIKNSIDLSSGFLSMTADSKEINNPTLAKINKDHRLYAMQKIENQLRECGDNTEVDAKAYIAKLARDLVNNAGANDRIDLDLRIEDFTLDINKMIPLAIITNELMMDSINQGFSDNRNGTITLSMSRRGKNANLSVHDNGHNHIEDSTHGYAAKITKSILEVFGGSHSVSKQDGTLVDVVLTVA